MNHWVLDKFTLVIMKINHILQLKKHLNQKDLKLKFLKRIVIVSKRTMLSHNHLRVNPLMKVLQFH